MKPERKERINRLVFTLNGFLFVLGGIAPLIEGKLFLGGIQLAAGLFNLLLLLPFTQIRTRVWLNRVVLLLNIVVAISVALDYISAGKRFIQYVWFLAALGSFIALWIQVKREKTDRQA